MLQFWLLILRVLPSIIPLLVRKDANAKKDLLVINVKPYVHLDVVPMAVGV